jgi:hypothetical protein
VTDARTLAEHSHDPALYPVAQGCPACMAAGKVNPDTGTPWPPLTDDDDEAVADAAGRFHDRLDGPDYSAALHAALTEAYLRGMMRGRLAEAREATRRAERQEAAAERAVSTALERMRQPGAHATVARELLDGILLLSRAAGLRESAGHRGQP